MKIKTTLKSLPIFVRFQIVIGLVLIGFTPASRAGLNPPYTNDFYTLHLWHLQDTSGTIAGIATNGVYFEDSAINPLVNPLEMTNVPGGGNYDVAGASGPGAPLVGVFGTNFGYSLSLQSTQSCGLYAPTLPGNGGFPSLSYANTNDSCSFVNTNTGAYTWEAVVQFNFNPLVALPSDANPEIISSDGGNSTVPGANPYTVRANQFRINVNSPANKNSAIFEWNGNISLFNSGQVFHDAQAPIPTTGPDQFIQGNWYHMAVAYTGTTPTNGDPPNVLTMYWTPFSPSHTTADVLTNFYYFGVSNTSTHTIFSYAYPSNSIIGCGIFDIGNDARGETGGWIGNIAEVRISDCYRHPNEFMFNSTFYPTPPILNTLLPTNTLVGYGQSFNLNLQVVSATTPWVVQWYQVSGGVTNLFALQTNVSSVVVSNITYAANSTTYFAVVTNAYGSATSTPATVTVGATFEKFFNTGVDDNNAPLDQTAPGSVDLHWMFPPGGNATSSSSNCIVWSDAGPLQSGGGIVPGNGASVWIGPVQNGPSAGASAGTYTFQTSFQVDESVVTTNTAISGIFGCAGGTSGQSMTMSLNGVQSSFTMSGNVQETIYAFKLTNGLLPGTNTLQCTAAQAGGDFCALDFGIVNDTFAALTNAPIITNQPVSVTNVIGSPVSFSAVALGAPPLMYYWLSNGVAITPPVWVGNALPNLSFVATNFSPSELVGTNFFANYQIVFSNFVGSVTSAVATLDVQIPPMTVSFAGTPIWGQTNTILVFFSSPVDPTTATTAGNYTVTGGAGATVLSATLGPVSGEVILTTTPLTPGTTYTVTVQNVNSVYGYLMNPSPASTGVGMYPTNTVLWIKAGDGVIADGNGNVSQWNDLSAFGNNLQTGGSDPLLLANAIDGQPMVEFNGTNGTYLFANDAPSLKVTGDMSVFAVVNFATLAGGTNGDIISKVNNNNQPAPYDYYAQSGNVHFLRGNGSGNAAVNSTTGPAVGVPHILDVVMLGTNVTHRLDGNPNGTGRLSTAIADSSQPVSIGAREDFHNFLTGGIAELILVGQALSSNDVASLENYFATEYHMPTGTNSYPIITQEPVASTNVNQGGTLFAPAAASGTPAVAFQWYDANNILQTGQTNAILVISNDVVSDSYYLVATNVYGSATSSVVAVTVISGLNVSLGPPAITLYTGQSVTLTAAASGTFPFYYQWNQNGSPVNGAISASYTATASPTPTTITCTVTNSANGYSSTNAGPVTITGIAAPTSLYQATVVGNHPIAFWRLSEVPDNGTGDNGTIAYDYAGGHNAAYNNAELGLPGFGSLSSTDTAALFGVFAPSNSYAGEIDQSGAGLPNINFAMPSGGNAEFSIEAWVNSTNTQVQGAGIVAKGYGNGGEQFDLDVFGGFRFFVRDASGAVHGETSTVVPVVGQWYDVVAVWDGANGASHLYVNGLDVADTTGVVAGVGLLAATTTSTNLPAEALVSIGARASGASTTNFDFQFQGLIDDVAIYNYALSPTQVHADYDAGAKDVVFSTTPTNVTFSATANNLTLTWPVNHTGWTLQAQTNRVSVGLSSNWVNVAGSAGINQVVVPINLTNGTVFYRLTYQP
ncbi:MAG TPA: LamG-like jellyroll fold domain-containing protein [Verrucomicrobiae bacterium]|jgi:hypothetical protein|nr:LamG-like jellyroll fold domain-containing protein [Verrucomicrobiae bacterium]